MMVSDFIDDLLDFATECAVQRERRLERYQTFESEQGCDVVTFLAAVSPHHDYTIVRKLKLL